MTIPVTDRGVSVIIPTHSRPHLLPRAVESVRAASAIPPEIIIVDDASTDETADVCRGLAGVKYIRLERNQGVAGARNVGLLASTQEYVAFLDDGDRRLPGSLDLQAVALQANPQAGFCCGSVLPAAAEGRSTGDVIGPPAAANGGIFWSLLQLDFIVRPVGVVVRKSAILAAGLLKPRGDCIDDWDLWVRLAELFPVVTISEPVGISSGPARELNQASADFARGSLRLLRHQRELLRLPLAATATPRQRSEVRRQTARRLADMHLQRAALWSAGGRKGFALRHLMTGLWLAPTRVVRTFVDRDFYTSIRECIPTGTREGEAGINRETPPVSPYAARASAVEAGSSERVTGAVGGETVSIIIATHDRPRLVQRAIESALAAGRDVEIIVVDDASPSNETEDVCRRYEGVKYFRAARNQKLGGARNVGIVLSSGAFITFLDDDDTRLPGSLDAQRDVLLADPGADMVYGRATLEWAAGDAGPEKFPEECPEGDIFWQLMERNFVPCPAAVFRREALLRVGLPQDTTPGEDWDYWLRIAEVGRVLSLSHPVASYRKGNPRSGQVTSSAAYMVRELTNLHRNRWQRLVRARADVVRRREAWRAFSYNMATHLVWETGRALEHGRVRAAAQNVWTALTLHPFATLRRATAPSNARFITRAFAKLLG